MNYIIDEAQLISKGSNAVVSYLHHCFDSFGLGETDVQLHCDNCSGQKKSFCLVVLCLEGVRWPSPVHFSQFYDCRTYKICPADGCFGLLKRAFKRHAVSSLEDFEKVVNESACVNQAQLIGRWIVFRVGV